MLSRTTTRHESTESIRSDYMFAVRCPVLIAPIRRPHWNQDSVQDLVNLLVCHPEPGAR